MMSFVVNSYCYPGLYIMNSYLFTVMEFIQDFIFICNMNFAFLAEGHFIAHEYKMALIIVPFIYGKYILNVTNS